MPAPLPLGAEGARSILPMGSATPAPRIYCGFEITRPAACEFRYFDPSAAVSTAALGSGDHQVIRDAAGGTLVLTTRPLGSDRLTVTGS